MKWMWRLTGILFEALAMQIFIYGATAIAFVFCVRSYALWECLVFALWISLRALMAGVGVGLQTVRVDGSDTNHENAG